MELKSLPNHLKYAYLDNEQQLSVIIANNLHQEQEDKLLEVLRGNQAHKATTEEIESDHPRRGIIYPISNS
ncbi:hypothetical protein CR513_49318, partial [Mucuna pruriens]